MLEWMKQRGKGLVGQASARCRRNRIVQAHRYRHAGDPDALCIAAYCLGEDLVRFRDGLTVAIGGRSSGAYVVVSPEMLLAALLQQCRHYAISGCVLAGVPSAQRMSGKASFASARYGETILSSTRHWMTRSRCRQIRFHH